MKNNIKFLIQRLVTMKNIVSRRRENNGDFKS